VVEVVGAKRPQAGKTRESLSDRSGSSLSRVYFVGLAGWLGRARHTLERYWNEWNRIESLFTVYTASYGQLTRMGGELFLRDVSHAISSLTPPHAPARFQQSTP